MDNSHLMLVGPPLIIISLFCFGLVLLHPAATTQQHPGAISQAAPGSQAIDSSLPPIAVLTDTQPPLATLETVQEPAGTAGVSQAAGSTTVQPSGTNSNQLQAVTANVDPAMLDKPTNSLLTSAKASAASHAPSKKSAKDTKRSAPQDKSKH